MNLNKKRLSIAIGLIILFFASTNLSHSEQPQYFQFEDYKWGTSIDKVREQIKSKDTIKDDSYMAGELEGFDKEYGKSISYITKIFDKCSVRLCFTEKEKLLYAVNIIWYPESVNMGILTEKVMQTLNEKYGKPTEIQKMRGYFEYRWEKGDERLEYQNYSSGMLKYENIRLSSQNEIEVDEKEKNKINSEDAIKL